MHYSVLAALDEIKDFVRHCKKDEELAGFNVCIVNSGSVVIGKRNDSLKPRYVLHTPMDYANPVQRPLIANAINEALYGESMTPEAMEAEMIDKADPM